MAGRQSLQRATGLWANSPQAKASTCLLSGTLLYMSCTTNKATTVKLGHWSSAHLWPTAYTRAVLASSVMCRHSTCVHTSGCCAYWVIVACEQPRNGALCAASLCDRWNWLASLPLGVSPLGWLPSLLGRVLAELGLPRYDC